ncbi:hypothetical protein GFC01_07820 [Desulfofundulus thermobenzoicus]|uniref:Uncharacterized protein n=1 Tax=Desulfofundulus thermobenzoicus TaxID=29376 RepID=A0A6N7IRP3_9FIRM|nr:hypothetical protein [Desulfofundulus thermobenzoicus]MQL52179.1 hypothetical protein [Desulfofundulus thermobenzoicus]
MSEVLGKIEKPATDQYRAGRKLYLVPLLYVPKEVPEDFQQKVNSYWQQVEQQLNSLESKMGAIKKIYHESLAVGGDTGLSLIQKFHEKSYQIIKEKCDRGASLQATEDMELFTEAMDWGNCLQVVMSQKTFDTISKFYREASEKRFAHISRQIEQTLGEGETGALFIREDHGVQFPPDVHVFYVSPPALDDIHRWFREQLK